jgi:tetratricopeptide (TPR) repeat protein
LKEPFSARDPQQLPLGMHEGEPLIPVEHSAVGEEMLDIPLREPPVCGEWSYDDSELEDTRFVARRIDGITAPTSKATPVMPITVLVDPKAMAARQDRAPDAERSSAPRADGARSARPTVEALRIAFEQSPGDTTRALTFAAMLERSGDASGALKALEQAKAAGAEPFAVECARASALGAMLKYDEAAKAIKAAAKLRPDHPEIDVQTGILDCRRAKWKDAIEPLQRGVAGAPDHAQAHYYFGEALNKSDRLEEARAAYERAAALDPENWRALKGVGVVLDRLGRSTDAASWYRRAREAQRA